jgi:hypothetical protein
MMGRNNGGTFVSSIKDTSLLERPLSREREETTGLGRGGGAARLPKRRGLISRQGCNAQFRDLSNANTFMNILASIIFKTWPN